MLTTMRAHTAIHTTKLSITYAEGFELLAVSTLPKFSVKMGVIVIAIALSLAYNCLWGMTG